MTQTAEYPFGPLPMEQAAEHIRAILRDRPMTKVTMPVGGDVWVVHRNKAAKELLSDKRFVREPFRTGEREVPFMAPFPDMLRSTLQFEDPPQHTKLRKLVQKGITPRRVKAMRESAVAFANELIDQMVVKGGTRDLISEYAMSLPIQMLSNLLGVPVEDRERFEHWSSSFLETSGKTVEEMGQDVAELAGYMSELIARRREEPREDLLSALANARDKDETLTDDEILPIAFILIIGGFDNTATFLASGVLALLRSDDQRERLLADIDGLASTAAEEVLRHGRTAVSLQMGGGGSLVPFVATEDVEIDGQLVKEGEAIAVDPGLAGHDPEVFDDPFRFDIGRTDNPHLTLSHGLHHCLGAPLARMELQVGITELFRRLPGLRLDGEPTYSSEHISQPMTSMPVAW
ncbi:cytochrome P450 [Saccharopolyspora gregorii]|uniref:cytochrome P450 n=1 Tax=Saccharopolyspora gregorii TaxID=33914 RepID=UPI0021AC0B7A|nr:cytochrome P450 [Saccharopolyspora gregorii]